MEEPKPSCKAKERVLEVPEGREDVDAIRLGRGRSGHGSYNRLTIFVGPIRASYAHSEQFPLFFNNLCFSCLLLSFVNAGLLFFLIGSILVSQKGHDSPKGHGLIWRKRGSEIPSHVASIGKGICSPEAS